MHLQLRNLSRGVPSSHLEKDERLILGHMYLFMKASRVVLRGVRLREEIWSIYNAKYAEM